MPVQFPVSPLTAEQIKLKTARLCELCEALWPEEWPGKYIARQGVFRTWLNGKTGLNVNHITNKSDALIAWVNRLEELAAE